MAILLIFLAYLISCGSSDNSVQDNSVTREAGKTPVDFKVAIFGDLGTDKKSKKLLKMIRDDGADMVLHLGDIDYDNDPAAHSKRVERIFGADFPYLTLIGNHDEKRWYGEGGYQRLQEERFKADRC